METPPLFTAEVLRSEIDCLQIGRRSDSQNIISLFFNHLNTVCISTTVGCRIGSKQPVFVVGFFFSYFRLSQ